MSNKIIDDTVDGIYAALNPPQGGSTELDSLDVFSLIMLELYSREADEGGHIIADPNSPTFKSKPADIQAVLLAE